VKPSRLLTAAILLPLLAGLIFGLPSVAFAGLVAAAALGVQYEFYRLFFREGRGHAVRPGLIGVGLSGGGFLLFCVYQNQPLPGMALACIGTLAATLFFHRKITCAASDAALLVLGLVYPTGLLAHLMLIRNADMGREMIAFLLLVAWGGDAAAYYVGRAMGRKKLAPVVSPNKTIEGAVGGLVGSVLCGGLAAWIFHLPLPPVALVSLALVMGGAGQVGDLVESLMKRSAGVKDAGGLIPAHGGLFDKLDSVAFAAPVLYYYLLLS
jgi:phosphatidate cytidylyltransferase